MSQAEIERSTHALAVLGLLSLGAYVATVVWSMIHAYHAAGL